MTPNFSLLCVYRKQVVLHQGNLTHLSWYKFIQMAAVDIHLSPLPSPIPSDTVLFLKK